MREWALGSILISLVLVGGFALEPVPAMSSEADIIKAACSLTKDELVRMYRGVQPGRSGQILIVSREPNFVGANFPHSGPWDYLQRVPMLWYGPGYIPATGSVDAPVTMADVAPTQAELLDYEFSAPDGKPMPGAVLPASERPNPPRLIVTVVWDAGGRDVLDTWKNEWPNLERLASGGVWYENAEVGTSPSITPAVHGTLGTGAWPRRHGQVDADFEVGGQPTRSGDIGPGYLEEPTLADLYDRAMGNEPLMGNVATVNWHQNMLGHGAMWGGGDRDVEVLRQGFASEGTEGDLWNLNKDNEPFFAFPRYANDLPPLSTYVPDLDRADGKLDRNWRTNSIAQLRDGWDTPARLPFETRVIETVLKREGFGRDTAPDMFFTNYKVIDDVGHMWSINSPEMKDAIAWQDAELGELVEFLNRLVGHGKWVLLVTADHGHQYDTSVSGAFGVSPGQLQLDLEAAFDHDPSDGVPAIKDVRDTQIFVDEAELRQNGYTLDDVSRFVINYTKGQAETPSTPVPAARAGDEVMQAAIPTAMMKSLPCFPENAA